MTFPLAWNTFYLNSLVVGELISQEPTKFTKFGRRVFFSFQGILHQGLVQGQTFEEGPAVNLLLDEVVVLPLAG